MPHVTASLHGSGTTRPAAAASVVAPAGTLAVELVALLAVRLRDPHVPGSWGSCPVLQLTGYPCPFCGGTRAAYDLMRGDVLKALSQNVFAVAFVIGALTLTLAWLIAAVRARRRGEPDPLTRLDDRRVVRWVAVVLVAWVVFGLVRLWPPLAWLRP